MFTLEKRFFLFLARKRLMSFLFGTFVLVSCLYCVVIGVKNLFRYNIYLDEVVEKKSYFNTLVFLNRGYKKKLNTIKSDDYWLREAKMKLGYVEQGEQVIKFY